MFGNIMRKSAKGTGIVLAAIAGTIIGGAATGVVMASIPDGNNVIHGCYDNKSGVLTVVDSATATCTNKQTELDWNQTGPSGPQGPAGTSDIAYGYIPYSFNTSPGNSITPVNSNNITQAFAPAASDGETQVCLQTSFMPHVAVANDPTANNDGLRTYVQGIGDGGTVVDSVCGGNFNVLVDSVNGQMDPGFQIVVY